MNPSPTVPSHIKSHADETGEQARPGHGLPSQDPNPAAQFPLEPQEAMRESQSVLTGGGMVGGAALGATIGIAAAGPVGVVVGGAIGAVAGALSGAALGATVIPEELPSAAPLTEDSAPKHVGHPSKASGMKP